MKYSRNNSIGGFMLIETVIYTILLSLFLFGLLGFFSQNIEANFRLLDSLTQRYSS